MGLLKSLFCKKHGRLTSADVFINKSTGFEFCRICSKEYATKLKKFRQMFCKHEWITTTKKRQIITPQHNKIEIYTECKKCGFIGKHLLQIEDYQ